MAEPRHSKTKKALRRRTIGRMARQLQLVLLVIAAAVVVLFMFSIWRREPPSLLPSTPTTPVRSPRPTLTPHGPTLPPTTKRVGILAGHSGPQNDPGAVCPDGLRETDINLTVAEKVVAALNSRGYQADLLEEFDDRLQGYRADAFLAIHTDSCDIPEVTGFKVAHISQSAIPEIEDILVECLYQEYARATGLPRHDFSITPDMHEYHAFRQIDPETPGAIIELGFMAADRYILVNEPKRLAAGIVAGLICFLER